MLLIFLPLLIFLVFFPLAVTGYSLLQLVGKIALSKKSKRYNKIALIIGITLTAILCLITEFRIPCYTLITVPPLLVGIFAYIRINKTAPITDALDEALSSLPSEQSDDHINILLHSLVYLGMLASLYIIYLAFTLASFSLEYLVAFYLSLLPVNLILLGAKCKFNHTAAVITPIVLLVIASGIYLFEKNILFGGFFL